MFAVRVHLFRKIDNLLTCEIEPFKDMKLIERSNYLNRILDVVGTPDIKVITGIKQQKSIDQ